ncbi:hypothetical protein GCM10008944_29330 [Cytobacillus oceanisediminis]
MTSPGPLVVGHDGSRFSDSALAWALDHAEAAGLPVHVVRAWSISTAARPADARPGFVPGVDELGRATQAALEADTADARAAHPDVPVTLEAVHGPADDTLLEASRGASMVVIGPRGLGGFAGLLLGSVSDRLVRHASCPVLVLRGQDDASAPRSRPIDSVVD